MPKFTAETPTIEAEIMGLALHVPAPFAEGHVLTPVEARGVNRFVSTAVGNAFGSKLRRLVQAIDDQRAKDFKAKTYTGPVDEKGKPAKATIDDISIEDLGAADFQTAFNTMYSDYEVGAGRGAATSKDPAERFLITVASAKLNELLAAKGKKVADYRAAPATDTANFGSLYEELRAQLIDAMPELRETARRMAEEADKPVAVAEGFALPDLG